MSHAGNKVKWCLNKAKKELAQGTKHRGLLEIKPGPEDARKNVLKAEHNFKAMIFFEKNGFADWSISAAFYTIYHCFLAIITKQGYESRNQECTIAMIRCLKEGNKISITDEIINALECEQPEEAHESNVLELRENCQYGTETTIENKKFSELKELCKRAIDETKKEIYSQ